MIKKLKLIAIIKFLCISTLVFAQQNVEPYMLEVPNQKIQYKINGEIRNVTVSNFYINQFPESNKEYGEYLEALPPNQKEEALPKRENLKTLDIGSDLRDFLLDDYYFSAEYGDYPIVGLDYDQIYKYLKWKTNKIGKLAIEKTGFEFNSELSYFEIWEAHRDSVSIPLQTEFFLVSEALLLSARKYLSPDKSKYKSSEPKSIKVNHKYLKKLKLKSIYEYDLSDSKKYKKLDELISFVLNKEPLEEGIKSLCGSKKNKYKSKESSESLLKPFRTWNIKIRNLQKE